jgi:hypothetical protein
MATKRINVGTDSFVKVNNGGIVSTSGFVMQILDGKVFIGATDVNTNPPAEENCYQINDDFVYTGSDDVYIKAMYHDATVIIDKV